MRPFVVTILRWHHSDWVFNIKTFPNLLFGFGKIRKGSWKCLDKIVVQPFLRQLLLPSVGGATDLSSSCCLWNSPKGKSIQMFLFAVFCQNSRSCVSDFNLLFVPTYHPGWTVTASTSNVISSSSLSSSILWPATTRSRLANRRRYRSGSWASFLSPL